MPLVWNPVAQEMRVTDDPDSFLSLGWRQPTPEEAEHWARNDEFGTLEQQSVAQLERITRGATLGMVEGFGDDPEAIRARADVSRELSPVTSFAADVLPDVGVAALTGGLGGLATGAGRAAGRAALAEGAGLVRAGLAAGRAGGAAALAAESAGTGLVGAGQAAYAEGRDLFEDPGRDAENALIWGGLNFGLGAFMLRRGVTDELIEEGGEAAARELDDIAAAAEVRETAKGLPEDAIPGTPGQIFDVEGAPAPAAAPEFVALETQLDEALADSGETLSPKVQRLLDRMRAFESRASGGEHGGVMLGRFLPKGAQLKPKSEAFKNAANMLKSVKTDEITDGFIERTMRSLKNEQFDGDERGWLEAFLRHHQPGSTEAAAAAPLPRRAPAEAPPIPVEATPSIAPSMADGPLPEPADMGGQGKDYYASPEALRKARLETENFIYSLNQPLDASDAKEFRARQARFAEGTQTEFDEAGEKLKDDLFASQGMSWSWTAQRYEKGTAAQRYVAPGGPRLTEGLFGSRGGQRGMAQIGGDTGSMLGDLATGPLGNVMAAGAGAAIGGAVGGEEGAMIGAGLGFGASLGSGAALRARAGRRLEAAAVRRGEREAVDGGMERALRNASKSDAADVVERAIGPEPTAASARQVENEASSFGRQRRLYINRKAIRQVATKEMQKDLTELVENVRQMSSVEKLSTVSAHVSDNLGAQRAVAKGVAQQAAEFAGQLRAEAKAYAGAAGKKGLQYAIPGQRDLVGALMGHAKEVSKATDGKALFEALDGFKRAAQEHKVSLEKGMLNSESALHYEKLIPRVEEFASSIRSALEDSTTWGRAGQMQRAYNAVISEKLIPQMKQFESAVLQKTHRGYDGLWQTEGWEGKIRTLLADADGGNRRHVGATLDAMDELADVARKYGDTKAADAVAGQVAKVRRTIGLADEVADAEERMHSLGQIIGGGPMGGAFAGALAGGLPGAAIGAALPGAVRGFVMGDLIEGFQRLSGATDAAVKRGVDDWIRSSRVRAGGIREKLPKLPTLSDEAKQLRDVASRRGVTQAMALFMGEDSTPHAAYKRLQDSLLDGEKFFQDLSKEYGTLAQEAPDVFMMLAARADGDRQFLIQRMPPNVAVSMASPEGYPPSRDSIEDWATYVNAVRYPMRVARSIGSMRVQEAEALRERRPRVYELLQQRVIEGIQNARRSGEQVDDVALAKINLLFPEVDGLASPVFSRELGQVVVDYNLAKRERERGGGASSAPPDKRGQLPAQAMAQQGATFGMRG